jgi:hypothetical protein
MITKMQICGLEFHRLYFETKKKRRTKKETSNKKSMTNKTINLQKITKKPKLYGLNII